MDTNTTGETFSTNDSQDMSSSQQASTASEGQYGFDEGNSTSSLHESPHDEVVNSAIMEVSGELMLGRFKPHKQPSGGSESSDISDDDGRRGPPGGSIAKYPESSTGLSDNDWNPYATESDTNQTPRSPRSNASDDQNRPGFISRATFNFTDPQTKSDESTATVSMTTGEVTVDKNIHAGIERNENLGILRYMIESSGQKERDIGDLDDRENDRDMIPGSTDSARSGEREDEDARTETPDTVRSLHTDGSKSNRQSVESERSDDFRRESAESGKSFHTETSGRSYGRLSTESGRSDRSDSYRSGRQSTDSGRSGQSSRYDMDKSGENGASGRQSAESYHSLKSDHSRHSDQSEHSQKSTGRSNGNDRSDRLDRLGDVGENIKELIEFESAQRAVPQTSEKDDAKAANDFIEADQDRAKQDGSNEPVTRIRLTARLEPYTKPKPVISAESPEISNKFSGNRYVSVAERQRLLSESPEPVAGAATGITARAESRKQDTDHQADYLSQMDRHRPAPSSMNLPGPSIADRSPSDLSLKRVSDLFDETKSLARAAVSIPRPEPSGSEERFPLKERLDWSNHEDSFLSHNRGMSDRSEGKLEKSRDSEAARSITSEEVARVLGKYDDDSEAPVSDAQVKVSAFDKLDPADFGPGSYQSKLRGSSELADSMKAGEMSDDEIARRVKAILSDTNHYGVVGGNGTSIHRENIPSSKMDYVPRTIDYSRLHRDLQDIQDNLHDVPETKANDSLYVQKRNVRERSDEASPANEQDPCKSLETTGSGSIGRESGASEYGRKLVWDHGADLNYDTGYKGEFMGTDTNTLSSRRFGTGDSDTLRFRPDSAATDATLGELDSDPLRTSTDISRAEKIVKQVMDRRAEGDLKENVEDIIAKYRNERRDLFDKHEHESEFQTHPPPKESGDNISTAKYRVLADQMKHGKESGAVPRASDLASSKYGEVTRELSERLKPGQKPTLLQPENHVSEPLLEKPTSPLRKPVSSPRQNGRKDPGLAERVYKILTTDPNEESETDEKGMAKEVYKILAQDRPQEQVNGILSSAMKEENEMLKKMASQAADKDSSLDDSGLNDLNDTADSTFLEGRDIRKQLEWSMMSSPEKGDKTGVSDYTAIRKVTSAPYSSVSNAKTLLSSQLKKMTERNFDKSVELRTPYRQAIACYPVYGMEKDDAGTTDQDRKPASDHQGDVREAWMPRAPAEEETARRDRDLASDRFYLTDKDRNMNMRRDPADIVQHSQRRLSDPFDVSPSHRDFPAEREHHMRSRSEEAANISEFSEYSFHEPRSSPSVTDRRAASSPKRSGTAHDGGTLMTPDTHRPQEWSCECYTSRSDSSDPRYHSDSSGCHGNMLYHYGYQMYNTRDPENDLYGPYERLPRASPYSEQQLNSSDEAQLFSEDRVRELRDDRENLNRSPVKMMNKRHERQSRSRKRHQRGQSHGSLPMSKSLPNYKPERGIVEQVPFTRDDVYDLLTRSEAQEEKLAQLQRKLHQQSRSPPDIMTSGSHGSNQCRHSQSRRSAMVKSQNSRGGGSPSPTESDTSSSRRATRLRPYRPSGSRDVYYTESGDDTNESGTTVESTHPGSDDAVPPYIPKQFLGSRQDEPSKHSAGIYGVPASQEVLSTIDEQSAKDEKEKALSVSTGSGKEETGRQDELRSGRKSPFDRTDATLAGRNGARASRSETNVASREPAWDPVSSREPAPSRTLDTGYQSVSSGYRTSAAQSVSPYNDRPDVRSRSPHCNINTDKAVQLQDQQRFKTREEFQAEFERQEQELKDVLAGRGPHRAAGGEARDQRWAGSGSAGVEPLEQLGASIRSDPGETLDGAGGRWEYRDSDGNEFRRLEPEPLYPQERVRHSRSRSDTDLVHLSPSESQRYSSPMQPGTRFLELSNQPSPISHHNSLTYQPGPAVGVPREKTARGEPAELPRVPVEREQNRYVPARTDIRRSPATLDLRDSGELPVRPLEPGSVPMGQPRSGDILEQVELGADPRRMGGIRPRDRSRSPPLQVRQKKMEEELTKINTELSEQVNAMQGQEQGKNQDPEEFEDNFPPSKKAQVLREVLEQEYMDTVPANINDMWTRFKEKQELSQTESSLNSTRLDALSGLLDNPTKHKVTSCGRGDRKKESRKNGNKENDLKAMVEEQLRGENDKVEERAMEKRSKRRHEVRQKHGLSEEESNGSYTELLMENERRKEREKRNARKEARAEKKGRSPKKFRTEKDDGKDSKGTNTEISSKARVGRAQLSDTADTLFSIPEDASVENSPCKAESEMRSRQRRHRNVIDPLMSKLRDKVKLQRDKIDKERRKEVQRVEKLKKLEMLLKAKRRGQLSDKAINVELQDVSSTTSVSQGTSDNSQIFSDDTILTSAMSDSDGSSTLRDSTVDSIKLQVKRYPEEAFRSPKKAYVESDSTESSDFSNIIVERLKQGKSGRKSPERGRKSSSKSKKVRVDEFGDKISKGKKDKKKVAVFGVEMDEDVLAKQLRNYNQYVTPDRNRRGKHTHDVSTMYPSPIMVSPPTRRRHRDVMMKSAAIQTSPSVRSCSPSYSYDEAPVAPVPLMSNKSSKSSRRRNSPSPTRSSQSSPLRKSSKSPTAQRSSKSTSTARKSSKSPVRSAPPIPRKLVESPMWKPERDITTPPHNSMFTPEEMDENTRPTTNKGSKQAWFIPMKLSKPWRQPFKERQAFAVSQETWEPESVSQVRWKNMVHGDVLKDKGDPNDVSRDTKFDLDPEGHPIGDENTLDDSEDSDVDVSRSKPLSKMSLQEAFLQRKMDTISRLRERQKRLNLAADERVMQAELKMERDRIFNEERRKEANPEAHPYSDNLYKPSRRTISKEEMREMTQKRFKKLPEVVEAEKMKKRQEGYSLNRLNARLFNKKVQRKVLVKADKWGR